MLNIIWRWYEDHCLAVNLILTVIIGVLPYVIPPKSGPSTVVNNYFGNNYFEQVSTDNRSPSLSRRLREELSHGISGFFSSWGIFSWIIIAVVCVYLHDDKGFVLSILVSIVIILNLAHAVFLLLHIPVNRENGLSYLLFFLTQACSIVAVYFWGKPITVHYKTDLFQMVELGLSYMYVFLGILIALVASMFSGHRISYYLKNGSCESAFPLLGYLVLSVLAIAVTSGWLYSKL